MGEVSHDCKVCFDQVESSQSNIYAQKQHVGTNLLLAREICVEIIERHFRTGLRVSVLTYKQEKGEQRMECKVQGKADVPLSFTMRNSIILRAHEVIAPDLCLQSCTRAWAIEHNNVAYSEDTYGYISAENNSKTLMEMVMEDMR